jgi:uncharacterized protein (DUF58 family)
VHGIEASGSRRAGFVMKAVRRGRYDIGPLQVGFVDPFGLARVRWRALGVSRFLVHPRVERLATPYDMGERRSLASTARRQPTGARGEDFYTLREYVEGDDLRKVHWPSTAKRGTYMIRQEETPWHTRSTILVDDRAQGHAGGRRLAVRPLSEVRLRLATDSRDGRRSRAQQRRRPLQSLPRPARDARASTGGRDRTGHAPRRD